MNLLVGDLISESLLFVAAAADDAAPVVVVFLVDIFPFLNQVLS